MLYFPTITPPTRTGIYITGHDSPASHNARTQSEGVTRVGASSKKWFI